MSDIVHGYSGYVLFVLKTDGVASLFMNQEPGKWREDQLELDRHKQYHGIFTKFTNTLEFFGDAKDYIENAYIRGGINVETRLTKFITTDVVNEDSTSDVKYTERYSAIADYNSKKIQGNKLTIKFNSNNLAEIVKSHETDDFEVERLDSIDDVILDKLNLNTIDLLGRNIVAAGESVMSTGFNTITENGIQKQEINVPDTGQSSVLTTIVSRGSPRHSSVDSQQTDETDPLPGSAVSNSFFVDVVSMGATSNVDIAYDFKWEARSKSIFGLGSLRIVIAKYQFNGSSYDFISEVVIDDSSYIFSAWKTKEFSGTINHPALEYNQMLIMLIEADSGNGAFMKWHRHDLKINTIDTFLPSFGVSFMFVHDVFERLSYILTGEKNRFNSKFFGRKGLTDERGNNLYAQDGLDEQGNLGGGLIGMVSGFWARKFDPLSEKYKSLQISLKDLLQSCQAVWNVGMGIETVNLKERIRIEELKYFYREQTIVSLPQQISNEVRTIDKTLFFSGLEIGYGKGGDYENEIGLDEPNTKTTSITPVRKSTNKYRRVSKVRADEYGLEITRQKPQIDFPDEDTAQDDHNWFLDLKRDDNIFVDQYEQIDYIDRIQFLATGILSPDTFRSMIFTPLEMLFRHGWIIRAGIEPYLDKFIKYGTSVANSTLRMIFIGRTKGYVENYTQQIPNGIPVKELERSRFLPEIIEFEHPVDDDLMELILGTTKTLVNGSFEEVPNWYFKMEWKNENGIIERGYLLNLKPKGKGKFKFQKANENLLKET